MRYFISNAIQEIEEFQCALSNGKTLGGGPDIPEEQLTALELILNDAYDRLEVVIDILDANNVE